MSRKFSNKKITKPKKPKPKNPKGNKKPINQIKPTEFNGNDKLFLIMSNYKNKQYNIDSTLDTWIKDIGTNHDYCFLAEKPLDKIKHYSAELGGKYAKVHSSYSNNVLLEFLKNNIKQISSFNYICFCTDTTYINVNIFDSQESHWGYVSAMLPTSVEKLKNIDHKISPEDVRMYHGEAGFCLSYDIVKELNNLLSKHDSLILDRWDATIGYCLYKMGAKFNHDEAINLFSHTILNHNSKDIANSKSYGYTKFYDKKNIFDTLKSKK